MAETYTDRIMDDLKAAYAEIDELRALLRRIDDVTMWELTPLGRGFQEEVEKVLGIGQK